jgi:hypothetical protein
MLTAQLGLDRPLWQQCAGEARGDIPAARAIVSAGRLQMTP